MIAEEDDEMAQVIIDLLETDVIKLTFKEDGDIQYDQSTSSIIFPIKWYEKGGDTWQDCMFVGKMIIEDFESKAKTQSVAFHLN